MKLTPLIIMAPSSVICAYSQPQKFDYATVPDQTSYMADKLKVTLYPTHFLIDKEGVLIRVLPNDVQLAEFLAKLLP